MRIVYIPAATGIPALVAETSPQAYTGEALTLAVQVTLDTVLAEVVEDQGSQQALYGPANITSGSYGLEARTLGLTGPGTEGHAQFDDIQWQLLSGTSETRNYAYNNLNQLTAITGAENTTYSYNDAGLMTQQVKNGVASDHAYDRLNRLKSVNVGGANGSYSEYSYFGSSWMRRSASVDGTLTHYMYDGFACVGQTTAGTTTLYGVPGQTPLWEKTGAAATLVYPQDGQGNITGLWNGTQYVQKYNYDAFGNVKTTDATGHAIQNTSGPRFQGQLYDAATDQVYLRNRYYSPGTGRFNAVDPVGYKGGHNLYGYAMGDPVNATDLMGEDFVDGIYNEDTGEVDFYFYITEKRGGQRDDPGNTYPRFYLGSGPNHNRLNLIKELGSGVIHAGLFDDAVRSGEFETPAGTGLDNGWSRIKELVKKFRDRAQNRASVHLEADAASAAAHKDAWYPGGVWSDLGKMFGYAISRGIERASQHAQTDPIQQIIDLREQAMDLTLHPFEMRSAKETSKFITDTYDGLTHLRKVHKTIGDTFTDVEITLVEGKIFEVAVNGGADPFDLQSPVYLESTGDEFYSGYPLHKIRVQNPFKGPAAKGFDWAHIEEGHATWTVKGRGSKQTTFSAKNSRQLRAQVESAWKNRKLLQTQTDPAGTTRLKYRGVDPGSGQKVEFWFNKDTGIVETAYPVDD